MCSMTLFKVLLQHTITYISVLLIIDNLIPQRKTSFKSTCLINIIQTGVGYLLVITAPEQVVVLRFHHIILGSR